MLCYQEYQLFDFKHVNHFANYSLSCYFLYNVKSYSYIFFVFVFPLQFTILNAHGDLRRTCNQIMVEEQES